jgi:hypothetical protein
MQTSHPETSPPAPVAPRPAATLAGLLVACSAPVEIELKVRGQDLRFVGRRLTPGELAVVRGYLDRALPPLVDRAKTDEEERYDLRDPEFVAKHLDNRRLARAFALFRAWPVFAQEAPPELDRADARACADWLDASPIEPMVLDVLFSATYAEVVGVSVERVNFS